VVTRRPATRGSLLWLLLLALVPSASAGWSGAGHLAICEITWQRLSPAAKDLVRQIRAEGGAEGTFAGSCVWPDEARGSTHRSTYEYHFVNASPDAATVELERDCPAYDCVLVAIRRYAAYVAGEPRGERERTRRTEALAFLGHFVGDLHQPLHVYARDRGGNDLEVTWFGESTNLHRIWDHHAVERAGIDGMRDGRRLARGIDPQVAASWSTLDVVSWANESLRLAREHAYRLPHDRRLGDAYFEGTLPVLTRRLQQAGVRLAALLDALATGAVDPARLEIAATYD
jgi:hypothetical protein